MSEIVILNRNLYAMQIPSADIDLLIKGTEVIIVHSTEWINIIKISDKQYLVEDYDIDAIGKIQSNIPYITDEMSMEDKIWNILSICYDPEISINIVDLGLIYEIKITKNSEELFFVKIVMTLTSIHCAMSKILIKMIENKILFYLKEIQKVYIIIVFEPPWNHDMISEQGKLDLGLI